MNPHFKLANASGAGNGRSAGWREAVSIAPACVLSVGSILAANSIDELLVREPHTRHIAASGCSDLYAIPQDADLRLVILNESLTPFELDIAGRLVRRRWPGARILVIRTGQFFLEDALYDERIASPAHPDVLHAAIQRNLWRRPTIPNAVA